MYVSKRYYDDGARAELILQATLTLTSEGIGREDLEQEWQELLHHYTFENVISLLERRGRQNVDETPSQVAE